MQTFLQILAVIGIILLCIVVLLLLVVGLVLFVPLRYKVRAHKENEISARIQATWLFHFFSITYMYPDPGEIVVRVLGTKVWKMKLGDDITEKTEEETVKGTENATVSKVTTGQEEEPGQDNVPKSENVAKEKIKAQEQQEQTKTLDAGKIGEPENQNIFEKIQYKIKNICDRMKKILEDYEYYRDLFGQKENRLLFERCKNRIFKILRHIKPRVLNADVLFGTGEPDSTGYLMAVYGMFIPVLGNHINLTPDFDRQIFEGRLYAKGRITVFTLLYNAIRIYFDDRLHELMDKLKRKDV